MFHNNLRFIKVPLLKIYCVDDFSDLVDINLILGFIEM